jgi:glycosyltransferase involved in cell wall biosynthesis
MANYNYSRYLSGAVESVLRQSFGDLELIVVDDGSTDDSLTVLQPFLADPRVRLISLSRSGQPKAKNAGIAATRGEFIAFLDADDEWLPQKLERQLPLFANPDVGVVYCRRTLMDETGCDKPYRQPAMFRGDVLGAMFRQNFVCFSSAVVRRTAFEECGVFDESIPLAIDYDLWLRVAARFAFDYFDEPLARYRTGHANLSRRVVERLNIALSIMRRFTARPESSRLRRSLIRRCFAETYCSIALARRAESRSAALGWYARAVGHSPPCGQAWRGLVSTLIPRRLKRLAGRGLWESPAGMRRAS